MENLRWILILAGVGILVLLYFSGKPKRSSSQRESLNKSRSLSDDDMLGGDPLMGEEPHHSSRVVSHGNQADSVEDSFNDFDATDLLAQLVNKMSRLQSRVVLVVASLRKSMPLAKSYRLSDVRELQLLKPMLIERLKKKRTRAKLSRFMLLRLVDNCLMVSSCLACLNSAATTTVI